MKSIDSQSYRKLLGYAWHYWRGWAAIIAVPLLGTLFSILQPWPMKVLVDNVLGTRPLNGPLETLAELLPGTDDPAGLLVWVVAAGLLFFVVNSTLDLVLTFLWIRTGQRRVYDLTCDLFSRLQKRSLSFHSRNAVGDLISRVTADSWCVHTVVDTLLFAPLHALVVIIGVFVVMLQIDPVLSVLSLAVAPFMAISSIIFGRQVRVAARARRDVAGRIQAHVQQILSGITIVQAFAQEEREFDRFNSFAADVIRAERRTVAVNRAYTLLSGLATTLGTGAILYLGSRGVLAGTFSVGSLLLFLSYLGTLQAQMKVFSGIRIVLQGAGGSIDRVMEIFDASNEVEYRVDARYVGEVRGQLTFENVRFGYTPDRLMLHDISLDLQPGETLAIVGATGAGKSTLVSLVPRFHDPDSGRVLLDGHDIRSFRLRSLRDQVGIVLQEPFLFPLTIAENIAYGRPGATDAEIESAARAANAHDFIERLPEGYQTVIGQRGSTLSGGERQRISIARALLKNAPILILDEPTSALDARTEGLLLEALERLLAGRTTLIIAHRLSTIRNADRIIVLEQGRIAESGTHDELMAAKGLYASFRDIQFRPREEMAAAVGEGG